MKRWFPKMFFRILSQIVAVVLVSTAMGAQGFEKEATRKIDREIESAIARKRLPGGVVWIERGSQRYHKAYGRRSVYPKTEQMTADTIFDAASLTKVVATTPTPSTSST